MMTDPEIAAGLARLRPIGYKQVPVEGTWRQDPFPEREFDGRVLAVVCEDPGISVVAVDRRSGEVWLVAEDGTLDLVSSSLALLEQTSRAYQRACRAARRVEDDDEALEALAAQTLAEVRLIDAAAVSHENQLWSTAIEEIEYGI